MPREHDSMPTCPGCGRAWASCRCDGTTERWLREQGDRAPKEIDTGRFCGDRSPGEDDRRRVGESPELIMRLREHSHALRARQVALRHDQAARDEERRRNELHLDILARWVYGEPEDVKELGRRYGHGHPWAVEKRQQIIAELYRLGAKGQRDVVAVSCRGCTAVITRWTGTGRPPLYCEDECRHRESSRRARARRMRRRHRMSGDVGFAQPA